MNESKNGYRPTYIREIARWWQRCLDAADAGAEMPNPPEIGEVMATFGASEEEAIRGLSVGEQLHWGGSSLRT